MQSCVCAAWEGKGGGCICTYCHRWSQVEGGRGTCTATDDCYLKNGIWFLLKNGIYIYTATDDLEEREGGGHLYILHA